MEEPRTVTKAGHVGHLGINGRSEGFCPQCARSVLRADTVQPGLSAPVVQSQPEAKAVQHEEPAVRSEIHIDAETVAPQAIVQANAIAKAAAASMQKSNEGPAITKPKVVESQPTVITYVSIPVAAVANENAYQISGEAPKVRVARHKTHKMRGDHRDARVGISLQLSEAKVAPSEVSTMYLPGGASVYVPISGHLAAKKKASVAVVAERPGVSEIRARVYSPAVNAMLAKGGERKRRPLWKKAAARVVVLSTSAADALSRSVFGEYFRAVRGME